MNNNVLECFIKNERELQMVELFNNLSIIVIFLGFDALRAFKKQLLIHILINN
jgi:hypothetical protein